MFSPECIFIVDVYSLLTSNLGTLFVKRRTGFLSYADDPKVSATIKLIWCVVIYRKELSNHVLVSLKEAIEEFEVQIVEKVQPVRRVRKRVYTKKD